MDAFVVQLPDQLGDLLRAARGRKNLTQAQVAKRLGVSIQAVSRLEQQAGKASFDRIHRLCLMLGLELVLRDRKPDRPTKAESAEW
jgi:HTH-type transcriptional regulator/antitoxin HipB